MNGELGMISVVNTLNILASPSVNPFRYFRGESMSLKLVYPIS